MLKTLEKLGVFPRGLEHMTLSHSGRRPFSTKTEKNEADTFEVTDIERRPRSNFLDHFYYYQAVTF